LVHFLQKEVFDLKWLLGNGEKSGYQKLTSGERSLERRDDLVLGINCVSMQPPGLFFTYNGTSPLLDWCILK
jgi:hypothetical protein